MDNKAHLIILSLKIMSVGDRQHRGRGILREKDTYMLYVWEREAQYAQGRAAGGRSDSTVWAT